MGMIRGTINQSLLQDLAAHSMLCIMHARLLLRTIWSKSTQTQRNNSSFSHGWAQNKACHSSIQGQIGVSCSMHLDGLSLPAWLPQVRFQEGLQRFGSLLLSLNHPIPCSPPRHSQGHQSPSSPVTISSSWPHAGVREPLQGHLPLGRAETFLMVMGTGSAHCTNLPLACFLSFSVSPFRKKLLSQQLLIHFLTWCRACQT